MPGRCFLPYGAKKLTVQRIKDLPVPNESTGRSYFFVSVMRSSFENVSG